MERRGFLTAGTWCVDRNLTVDRWPEEDTVARVTGITLSGGGSGCNFACDIALLDPEVPVPTQCIIGDDQNGDFLTDVARTHGIEASGMIRVPEAQTMVTDAYQSAQSRRRTHIFTPGTADHLCPDHFNPAKGDARFFHLGLPGVHPRMDAPCGDDANGWVTVLRAAQKAGHQTSLELVTIDPARLREIVLPCLPHLTHLVVNDFEIGALAGIETGTGDDTDIPAVIRAAQDILARAPLELVAVHFTKGAVLIHRDDQTPLLVPSVALSEADIKGVNGAGDAFAAGLFLGLHRSWSHADSLRLAHAAAAVSMSSLGTYTGMKPAGTCLKLAEEKGWRSA